MEPPKLTEQIEELLLHVEELRQNAGHSPEGRELALAVTALEDAQMRLNRAGIFIKKGELDKAYVL